MKRHILILTSALAIAVLPGCVTSHRSTAWEHKIISGRLGQSGRPPLAQQLEQATAEGWEVVTAASDDGYPFVILRRPK